MFPKESLRPETFARKRINSAKYPDMLIESKMLFGTRVNFNGSW